MTSYIDFLTQSVGRSVQLVDFQWARCRRNSQGIKFKMRTIYRKLKYTMDFQQINSRALYAHSDQRSPKTIENNGTSQNVCTLSYRLYITSNRNINNSHLKTTPYHLMPSRRQCLCIYLLV